MGRNSTTYTINFKAQYESLSSLEQELAKIQKKSGDLNLTGKEQEKVQELILKIQKLRQLIDEKATGDNLLKIQDFKEIDKIFGKLITQANNFSSALIHMLPADLQSKISDLKRQIDELNKANQMLGSSKGISTKTFNKQANAITMQQIQAAGPMANIADEQGNLITTYAQLKTRAEQLLSVEREMTAEEQQLLTVWRQVDAQVQPMMQEWLVQWNQFSTEIETNRQKIAELLAAMQELKGQESKGDAPLEADPKSIETYNNYTAAVNTANSALDAAKDQAQDHKKAVVSGTAAQAQHAKQTRQVTQEYDKNQTTLGKAVRNVVSYGSALTIVRNIYTRLISTITDMDKALTDMTVVTQLSREQAWQLTGTLQTLAKQTGMTTTEVANMTTMYLQQGKTLADSLELTEAAAKAARIAGISGSESINLLTNAMNGFQLKASQAMEVSDKFASLAAAAATDYEELATALSKVAAQANLAGMSMDFTLGLLTKGIEVTREAPETIGTALKTVISRMRELTDYGETLEDNVDVNRVDKALKNIGVSLLDENRQFRDLEDVLTEVGMKWDTLNTNQQANVAVALAGTRQQSRLIAMMQDFDRTQELVNISMNSAGSTAAQHRKYMEGLEAATTKLTTSYQGLITSFMNSDMAIKAINGLGTSLEFLGDNISIVYGLMGGILALYGPLLANKLADNIATAIANLLSVIHYKAIKAETEATKEQNKARSRGLLGIKETIAAKFLEITGISLSTIAKKKEKVATDQATTSEIAHGAAAKANPYVLIISLILALVAAWWSLNKETETGIRLQQTLSNLMSVIGNLLNALFEVLQPLLGLVMSLVNLVMRRAVVELEALAGVLEFVVVIVQMILKLLGGLLNGIKQLITSIPGLSKILDFLSPQGVINFLGKATDKLKEWSDQITQWFETSEEKSARLAGNIAKNQEKIYDLQQRKNTLDPLINEYEELSNKANKTAEDLQRMSEIESEVGELDESYKTKNGGIDWSKVKSEAENAGKEAGRLLVENYNWAIEGMNTGVMQEEFRSAVSDYYTDMAATAAKNGEISSVTASAISKNFQNAINSMTDEQMMALNKVEGGFENLYTGIGDFEKELANDSTLAERMQTFEDTLNSLPEDARAAFTAIYSIYKEFSDMLNGLLEDTKAGILYIIEVTGMTETEYAAMKGKFDGTEEEFRAHLKAGLQAGADVERMEGESDIDFKTRQTQAVIFKLSEGQSQDFKNAVIDSFTQSNQAIIEGYAKSTSSLDNLQQASVKAAQGTLTLDEMRQLQSEYPELFADEEWVANFKAGQVDITELRQKANDEARSQLELSKAIAQNEKDSIIKQLEAKGISEDLLALDKESAIAKLIAAGYTAEEADTLYNSLMNYSSQIALNDMQLEQLKYADLYSSELWKNMAGVTAEEVKQKRLQAEINKLAKEYEATTDPEKRTELLKQQAQYYAQMATNAKSIFTNDEKTMYDAAVEAGYIVDGEIVVTQEELIAMDASPELREFLLKNEDNIKNYAEYTNEYLEGYRSIIEEEYNNQKEILEKRKEEYEDYWDSLDNLEQEQERAQSKEDILAQLSAISGGSDAASNSLRKDLLSQLADLSKEEAEARKQEMRDAITENIDTHVEEIDKKLTALLGLSEEELTALLEGMGYDVTTPAYAEGGLVTYTGPAWVDGTKSRPEAFLDATDTQLIRQLVQALDYGSLHSSLSTAGDEYTQVVVENINITANELNNEQDFRNSGRIFAEEFAKAIKQRGITKNVKK